MAKKESSAQVDLPTLNFNQFSPHVYMKHAPSSEGPNYHTMDMFSGEPGKVKSKVMGSMNWHKDTGEISGITVNKPYRRLGVANTMFHEAHRLSRENGLVGPVHSQDRTNEGDAWAAQTGTSMPERRRS